MIPVGEPARAFDSVKDAKRLSVAVFGLVLALLQDSGLLNGKTLGVDATTLERTWRCA